MTRRAASITLVAMVVGYALMAGSVALERHWHLETQALDMGYADQVMWNTLHGRPFHFTVFRGDVGAEPGRALQYGPGANRDSLLAYHVELLFLPLSLLYLLYPGPEALIILLTITLALGALPAYWIARRQLEHRGAALAFGAMYLLSPSIQAANLADFHVVSLTGALLLLALFFLLQGHLRSFVALAALCVAAKEEVGMLVGLMGLYAWLMLGHRLGAAVAVCSFGWVALCFGVIMPHFNGGSPSLFAERYADALAQVHRSGVLLLQGRPVLPVADHTVTYFAHLLGSTGGLALLAPVQLLLAAPALAINGLSSSTWQHGGGAHYSAEVVPALIFAAICGTQWLTHQCRRWLGIPVATGAVFISVLGFGGALIEHWHEGPLPPAQRFTWSPAWPAASERAVRLRALLAHIPQDVPVSVQSNVFPHLSRREKIYVFPAVEDAEYVLLDVAGRSDPLPPDLMHHHVQGLRQDPAFVLLHADAGFLLFRRVISGAMGETGIARAPSTALPPEFESFARPDLREPVVPLAVSFDGMLEIVGYRMEALPEVRFGTRRIALAVVLRATAPIDGMYRFSVHRMGDDGSLRSHDSRNATQFWLPTDRWQPGELIQLWYPSVEYSPGEHLGLSIWTGDEAGGIILLRATADASRTTPDGSVVVLGRLP